MWSEPLTTDTTIIQQDKDGNVETYAALVRQNGGTMVAGVRCAIHTGNRTGAFGEMRVVDRDGGPKQTLRALRLLVREAFRFAAEQGIQTMSTEAPDQLLEFTRQMTGTAGRWEQLAPNHTRISGELAAARSHALETTDADGNMAE